MRKGFSIAIYFFAVYMVLALSMSDKLLSNPAQAATRYVRVETITMRTGPGIRHKVIYSLPSDQKVSVLESRTDWSRVKLPGGKEGWVLSRFLTPRAPAAIKLAGLEKEHHQLLKTVQALKSDSALLKEENQQLRDELEKTRKALDDTSNAYETLKKKSANFFTLESNYNEVTSKLEEQTEKASSLENRLKQKNIQWFLSGGGVLLTGFIIGLMFRRQRRQSSFLT